MRSTVALVFLDSADSCAQTSREPMVASLSRNLSYPSSSGRSTSPADLRRHLTHLWCWCRMVDGTINLTLQNF